MKPMILIIIILNEIKTNVHKGSVAEPDVKTVTGRRPLAAILYY